MKNKVEKNKFIVLFKSQEKRKIFSIKCQNNKIISLLVLLFDVFHLNKKPKGDKSNCKKLVKISEKLLQSSQRLYFSTYKFRTSKSIKTMIMDFIKISHKNKTL